MNKQEAIKKIDRTLSLPRPIISFPYNYEDGLRYAKGIINQIDEPEKVKLTKAQEEYLLSFGNIKSEGSEDWTTALYYIVRVGWGYLFTTAPDAGNDEISLNSDYYKKLSGNLDFDDLKALLIKALVDGYEVEKEPIYVIRSKGTTNKYGAQQRLCHSSEKGNYFWCGEFSKFKHKFTREELEQAGFGWVFDCEGLEARKVK